MVQATTLNAFSSERQKENVISRSGFKIIKPGASLVAPAQPVQETWVWSLTWEDPTCSRVTEPVPHHYWDCAPPLLSLCPTTAEPVPHHCWACAPPLLSLCSRAQDVPQLLKPACPRASAPEKPLQWDTPAQQSESSPCSPREESSEDPAQPKGDKWIKS